MTFKNPVGLAAGYDKDAVAIRGLAALGFGHLEVGTVTPRPQPGNPSPRVFRLPEDEAVINRMGFPSLGSEFIQKRLNPSLRDGFVERLIPPWRKNPQKTIQRGDVILGINLGKNKDTPNEEAVLDYLELLQCFARHTDYLAINISSPNTVGLRELQGGRALEALLTQIHAQRQLEEKALEKRLPLLVKLAPDIADADLPEIVGIIRDHGVDGIVVSNTTLARDCLSDPSFAAEAGGLSGRPLFQRSTRMLARIFRLTHGKLPLIGVGGIDSGDAALAKIEAGASLLQLYTGLVFQGPKLIGDIKRALVEAMQKAEANSLTPLVGRDAERWADRPLKGATS